MEKIIAGLFLLISICSCEIFVCPKSDGVFIDPTDNHKFYDCSNRMPRQFSCPSGLIFNVSLGLCDYDLGSVAVTTLPSTSTALPTTTTAPITTTATNLIKCDQFSIRDCGPTDSIIKYNYALLSPCTAKYSEPVKMITDIEILKDISSSKVMLKTVLEKVKPEPFQLPCIHGFGSCTVDVCADVSHNASFSQIFTPFGEHSCNISSGKYIHRELDIPLPPIDPLIANLLEGEYEGNGTLYDAETNQVYGCIHIHFALEF